MFRYYYFKNNNNNEKRDQITLSNKISYKEFQKAMLLKKDLSTKSN